MAVAWLALAAAAPAAFAQRADDAAHRRAAVGHATRSTGSAARRPPRPRSPRRSRSAAGGSDGAEQAALLLSLALLGGGVAGWVLSLRRPVARAAAPRRPRPLDAPVRPAAPRLWAPGAAAAEPEPAPVAAVAGPRRRPEGRRRRSPTAPGPPRSNGTSSTAARSSA